MATTMGYPPFSAPATLERRHRKWSDWFSNAKQAFMRPWRQKQRPRRGRGCTNPPAVQGVPQAPTSLTSFEGYSGQGFPDFSSRLSPLGGRPQSNGKSGEDFVDGAADRLLVNIPEIPAPSRPPLSNIFPMFNNSSEVTPLMRASSIKKAMDQRRHSTPITPRSQQATPTHGERRQSASSDTSADKPRQGRRERRASATRELPLLPKRGEDPFLPTTPPSNPTPQLSPYSEYNGPQISPFSEYNGPVNFSRPEQITVNFGPVRHPPVGAPSAFTYPPMWPQPHHQLQELEEELEEDGEGDGEEEGVAVIDEGWEGSKSADDVGPDFTPAGQVELNVLPDAHVDPSVLPASHIGPEPADTTSPTEPAQNKGALGKILQLVSSSKRKPDAAKAVVLEDEDDSDIKGFDNFFLY